MIIDEVVWFTGTHGVIGIVLGRDEHSGDPKAYIGLGDLHSEEVDAKVISHYGSAFMPSAAKKVFDHFNPPKSKG